MRPLRSIAVWLVCGAVLAASGCTFGPRALELSHGKFNNSLKQITDEQLLLNLIRLRYNETPVQVDVSGIAAQYELSATAEARPFYSTEAANLTTVADSFRDFSKILPFVGGSMTNRPTFSFTPLDDPDSVRQLFVAGTLEGIAFLAETSWPVSTVFRLSVDSMNRVPNARCAGGPSIGVVPEFHEYQRVMQIMQQLQDENNLRFSREEKLTEVGTPLSENAVTAATLVEAAKANMEYRQKEDKTWVLIRRDRKLALLINPKVVHEPHVLELCKILNLLPGESRYEIVLAGTEDSFEATGPHRQQRSIAIIPRSTIQSLFYMSYGVDVPGKHYECGLVTPTGGDGSNFDWQEVMGGLFSVRTCCGHRRPDCAAIAVKYRDVWYYIDDRDTTSKTTFSLVSTMTRVNLINARKGGPTLTLPVGR